MSYETAPTDNSRGLASEPDQLQILHELEPVVATNLDRHNRIAERWNPHDYVPYDQGRNFATLGGEDWAAEQSDLSPEAQTAMVLNLLTEDNLPSYHRIISEQFGRDGAWGQWVGTWTAEEGRHAIVMRDYLVVTRGVDPDALEAARVEQVIAGYDAPDKDPMHVLAYVTLQELATRVSHRNTGLACNDKIADKMLERVAKDENQHMIFYRNLAQAALEVAPNTTLRAIADEVKTFQMPGAGMKSFRRMAATIANAGIYDLPQHLKHVVKPVLRSWNVLKLSGLSPEGEQAQQELGEFLDNLAIKAEDFSTHRAKKQARQAEAATPPNL